MQSKNKIGRHKMDFGETVSSFDGIFLPCFIETFLLEF